MDKKTTDELKSKKGMILFPKILLFKLNDTLDILVYDFLDKIIFFSKCNTGTINITSLAKHLNTTDDKIIGSLGNLENIGIITGKIKPQDNNYTFVVNNNRIIQLNEIYNMTDEEKEFARELMSKMASVKTTKG